MRKTSNICSPFARALRQSCAQSHKADAALMVRKLRESANRKGQTAALSLA